MKRQVQLLLCMLEDLHTELGTNPKFDKQTIIDRSSKEGDPFLTVTLPHLDDLLTAGLRDGLLPTFVGWKSQRGSSFPLFLSAFWSRVFEKDGSLVNSPCTDSIRAIRQISRAFKKVFEVCSEARVESAISRFISVEKSLCESPLPATQYLASDVCRVIFGKVVRQAMLGSPLSQAHHGPGAVSERYDSHQKWKFDIVPERILESHGYEAFRMNFMDLLDHEISPGVVPARLIAVPKTAVKPRLISIEPSYNQFLQQGLEYNLRLGMDRMKVCSYEYQEPNQALARKGSIDGSIATIDLSDASDRVRSDLVRILFGWNLPFLKYIFECRSDFVDIESRGQTISLKKFASMGSALTFPIETMVFTALCVTAFCLKDKDTSSSYIQSWMERDDFRVYGDDIAIPSLYVPTVIEVLESFSLVVNREKSFWTGLFRESCGADYYAGRLVKPVYVRSALPEKRSDALEILKLSKFRDLWVDVHLEGKTTDFIDRLIIKLIGHYPYHPSPQNVDIICRRGEPGKISYNKDIQTCGVTGFKIQWLYRGTDASGSDLLRAFLFTSRLRSDSRKSSMPHCDIVDEVDYEHHRRPTFAKLRRGWASI